MREHVHVHVGISTTGSIAELSDYELHLWTRNHQQSKLRWGQATGTRSVSSDTLARLQFCNNEMQVIHEMKSGQSCTLFLLPFCCKHEKRWSYKPININSLFRVFRIMLKIVCIYLFIRLLSLVFLNSDLYL